MPVAGQAGENCAVAVEYEELNIMGAGAVGCVYRRFVGAMFAGCSGITCIVDILITDNITVFEQREDWFRGERHGSQAIAGTSGGAVYFAQHVHPENQLAFAFGIFFSLAQ